MQLTRVDPNKYICTVTRMIPNRQIRPGSTLIWESQFMALLAQNASDMGLFAGHLIFRVTVLPTLQCFGRLHTAGGF